VAPELSRTIDSLADSGVCLDCVIVTDGLAKLSESMTRYLMSVFGLECDVLRADSKLWGAHHQTFISKPVVLGGSGSTFAVLLKRFNHKKINTHEWFFRAHCPDSGCAYALTTDTGAVFRKGSVRRMIDYLLEHENVAAVTGRQRVMSEYHQRVLGREAHGEPAERDSAFERCMRLLQGFDFEIDHTGGKAASCAAGLLPCLHGPCAFFRFGAIRGRCLDEYFDDWGYAPPHTLKLIGANLQLAEDRIPSFLGVLYSDGMCSDSDFDAVFEFEAELSLRHFMTQRRRWINGTVAGTIYLLRQTPSIMASEKHSALFKVANVLLLALQALGFFLMFLTPGLFGFLFGSAAGLIATHAFGHDAELPLRLAVTISYGTLYAVFVAVHLKRTDARDCVLRPMLTKVVIGYNALLAFAVFVAIVLNYVVDGAWFLLAVYASVPGLPITCACLGGDFEGARLMAKSFPIFALASPSFVGSLSAYSAARIADLSWGNRPTEVQKENERNRESLGLEDDRSELAYWLTRQARSMHAFNGLLVLTNLGLMAGGYWLVDAIAFLPTIDPSWTLAHSAASSFEGAVELFLIFTFAWLAQQLVGLIYHGVRILHPAMRRGHRWGQSGGAAEGSVYKKEKAVAKIHPTDEAQLGAYEAAAAAAASVPEHSDHWWDNVESLPRLPSSCESLVGREHVGGIVRCASSVNNTTLSVESITEYEVGVGASDKAA